MAPVECEIEISAVEIRERIFRLTVRVRNPSDAPASSRNDALLHSLASAHVVLEINKGKFVSQTDPPAALQDAIAACQNTGVWPVLVGERGADNTILGLADHPLRLSGNSTREQR